MKPFDSRLLRYATGIRSVLTGGAVLGALRTAAILVWAWSIAQLIAWSVSSFLRFDERTTEHGRVFEGMPADNQIWWIATLAIAAVVTRSLSSWAMEYLSERGAITVKRQLREQALARIDDLGPDWVAQQSDASLALRLSRGLDALDRYFATYLPQLLLTVIATPILVLTLLLADPVSGITVLIVFPIIPVFMILVGLATSGAQERQWVALDSLSRAFLDAVQGLATLKLFRREQRQVARISKITEEYRSRTMKVLRITFLSGFVLDLAGTFSVALVAVTVGTRLVVGDFPLALGLFVLLLVPEAFIPIRQVGAAFHASAEGLTAANEVFEIIEAEKDHPIASTDETTEAAGQPPNSEASACIVANNFSPLRLGVEVTEPLNFRVFPGEFVVIAGPSGAGKTSILSTLLGTARHSGALKVSSELSWVGQKPGLLQGTVLENLTLGEATQDLERVHEVLQAAAAGDIDLQRPLGASGQGLSGGQAQRVAIARALYRAHTRDTPLLLLDEPSSALDTLTESHIIDTLHTEARSGRAVLVVSHREAVLAAADRIIWVHAKQPVTPIEAGRAT